MLPDLNFTPLYVAFVSVIVYITYLLKANNIVPKEKVVWIPWLLAVPFAVISVIISLEGKIGSVLLFICNILKESFILGAAAAYGYDLRKKSKTQKEGNENDQNV